MKIRILTFVHIIIIFFLSCKNDKTPIFTCVSDLYIKDSVEVGAIANFDFKVKNTGNEVLKVLNQTCSCECTFLDIKNVGIKVSDSVIIKGKITAYLNDKGKSKQTLCTFKTNTKEVFHRLRIHYNVK